MEMVGWRTQNQGNGVLFSHYNFSIRNRRFREKEVGYQGDERIRHVNGREENDTWHIY
jgi:hypothetical protein